MRIGFRRIGADEQVALIVPCRVDIGAICFSTRLSCPSQHPLWRIERQSPNMLLACDCPRILRRLLLSYSGSVPQDKARSYYPLSRTRPGLRTPNALMPSASFAPLPRNAQYARYPCRVNSLEPLTPIAVKPDYSNWWSSSNSTFTLSKVNLSPTLQY